MPISIGNLDLAEASVGDVELQAISIGDVEVWSSASFGLEVTAGSSGKMAEGSRRLFAVRPTGTATGSITYRWESSGGFLSQTALSSTTFTAQEVAGSASAWVRVTATRQGITRSLTWTFDVVDAIAATIAISPQPSSVEWGQVVNFSATVTGVAAVSASWSASHGSITQAGRWTAPRANVMAFVVYTIVDTSGITRSARLLINVFAPPVTPTVSINIQPSNAVVLPGGTINFSANLSRPAGSVVTNRQWSASRGSIVVGGIYTAPSTPGTDTVSFSVRVNGVAYSASVSVRVDDPDDPDDPNNPNNP